MAEILQFKPRETEKFGFKKVQKKEIDPISDQQMDLFRSQKAGLLHLPVQVDPFDLALMLDEQNDPKAVEAYKLAVEGSESIPDAYCNLAIIYSKNGQLDDAFDSLSKALVTDSRHFESHYNIANLYFDISNYRLAMYHYQFAAKINDQYPNLFFNLGLTLAMNSDYSLALQALNHYIEFEDIENTEKADELIDRIKKSINSV
ncbi:MAG: hypothetical protein KDD94_14395 [Calditrichaeota bacterium]|nr:hypothetical protein [Calditrichota bacterium]